MLVFLLKLAFELERITLNNFCSFHRVSCSQPTKFGKSIFTRFSGVLCHPEHPESNKSHFRPFSVLDSALWFFNKTRCGLRKSILKIILAPSLEFLTVSTANLINWSNADFGACSARFFDGKLDSILTLINKLKR